MNKKIICIHLFNNFSGSSNVLATVINGLYQKKYDITIITSFNNIGFLTNASASLKKNINYDFKKNKILRLLKYFKFQLFASLYLLKTNTNDLVYINTIYPFLPALIAKFKGQKVIYHIHEVYVFNNIFIKFHLFVLKITADKIICVSNYVKNKLNINLRNKSTVIYNVLSPNFLNNNIKIKGKNNKKQILMISSFKEYKGILEFCNLSKCLSDFNFVLICDTSKEEINKYFKTYLSLTNLTIKDTQFDVKPYYEMSDLILNLSNPKLIIETFGLTILEGMSYGLPAIVPPIGGISEIVDDGIEGFHVNVNNFDYLVECINKILKNENIYNEMSKNALKKSLEFNVKNYINQIDGYINT